MLNRTTIRLKCEGLLPAHYYEPGGYFGGAFHGSCLDTTIFEGQWCLVMETGGYLSHGAIVAWKFGIPAVVNMPGMLKQLEAGEIIEVDGNRGKVRRVRG